jgi:hypothetical protein
MKVVVLVNVVFINQHIVVHKHHYTLIDVVHDGLYVVKPALSKTSVIVPSHRNMMVKCDQYRDGCCTPKGGGWRGWMGMEEPSATYQALYVDEVVPRDPNAYVTYALFVETDKVFALTIDATSGKIVSQRPVAFDNHGQYIPFPQTSPASMRIDFVLYDGMVYGQVR